MGIIVVGGLFPIGDVNHDVEILMLAKVLGVCISRGSGRGAVLLI